MNDRQFDAVIVGGGPAGLSAAIALGRSRRSVLVVDGGEPRNAPASGVHNVLSRDGMPPREFIALGRAEARTYGVSIRDGEVRSVVPDDGGFAVSTATGTVRARRVVLASGVIDELPAIPGLRERWGRDALHCPYCHGWEVRDRRIGIIASGQHALHHVLLFRQLTERVTLFLNDEFVLTDADVTRLAARDVEVVSGVVERIRIDRDAIAGAEVAGRLHPLDAVVVAPTQRLRLPEGLDLDLVEHPMGLGQAIATGMGGATSVPGVWAAGNVVELTGQVMAAAAAGTMAGAMVNADLAGEDTDRAVFSYEARHPSAILDV